MGWFVPSYGRATVVSQPQPSTIREILDSSHSDCIHVVSGFHGFNMGLQVIKVCTKRSLRVGLLSEGADPRGAKGMLRRLLYSYQLAVWNKSLSFIGAMGTNGARWFENCAFPHDRIFPFIYVTEMPTQIEIAESHDHAVVQFVFLGQCIERKGVDLIIRALAPLRGLQWRFSIFGDGPSKTRWQKLVTKLNLDTHICFEDSKSNTEVLAILQRQDCLLLPSRFDGWGAVVNEALMRGVPVICSKQCGASELIRQPSNGQVYNAFDVRELTRALQRQIELGPKSRATQEQNLEWSKRLEGPNAAAYFEQMMMHFFDGGSRSLPLWDSSIFYHAVSAA